MKRPSIISIGEVLWDIFPDGERFGGAPANFACHAAIQGADVTMVSAVGGDEHGRQAIEILNRYGIDVSFIQIFAETATGTVGVELGSNGKPTYAIYEDAAWDRIAWNAQLAAQIDAADAVYFGTLGQRSGVSRATIRQAVTVAEAAGIRRVLDINLRPPFFDADLIRESVQLASILKLSDEELNDVCLAFNLRPNGQPESMLPRLLEAGGLDMITMTCAADGAVLITTDNTVNQKGIPTTVIDTVGAGDAFIATFLMGELRQRRAHENLRTACEVAAATCAHSGAVPVLNKTDAGERQ